MGIIDIPFTNILMISPSLVSLLKRMRYFKEARTPFTPILVIELFDVGDLI